MDISAAYIGLSGSEGLFNYVGAGALGTLATYAGPMLWIVLVVSDIVRSGSTGTAVIAFYHWCLI